MIEGRTPPLLLERSYVLSLSFIQNQPYTNYLDIFIVQGYLKCHFRIVNSINLLALIMTSQIASTQPMNQTNMTLLGNRTKLWKDSEITLGFATTQLSFSKQKRFKLQSIYWPEICQNVGVINSKRKSITQEQATKISKLIDEQQKNELRMNKLRKGLNSNRHSSHTKKDAGSSISTKKPFKLSHQNEQILNRLTAYNTSKQSRLRDRHGNRCNLYDDPEIESNQNQIKFMGSSTGFKTSRKMKLQLPHNYYPGPGTYQIKRYLSQLERDKSTRAQTSRNQHQN